jgi:hypothetical protein
MRFIHAQSGIYRSESDKRYYLFLRWHDPAGRTSYQRADFTTLAEASCFLSGALAASQFSKKSVRFETLTPGEYGQSALKRDQQTGN